MPRTYTHIRPTSHIGRHQDKELWVKLEVGVPLDVMQRIENLQYVMKLRMGQVVRLALDEWTQRKGRELGLDLDLEDGLYSSNRGRGESKWEKVRGRRNSRSSLGSTG